ncbi:MAG TPA: sugar ABC transporter permease [Gemmatimonadales bacterium]|nr:sugar ABC transporter permease [Gemmatimonadales bacterium]
MSTTRWAIPAVAAALVAASATLLVVRGAQSRYEREFAMRMARTTATYIAAVTPPPPPPPAPRPPPAARRGRTRAPQPSVPPAPPPPALQLSPAARSYHLPALLSQARALKTLPGWTSEVEVYYGTAPLVDATAPPLTPDDLRELDSKGTRWRGGVALVPLRDRQGRELAGAVAVRPLRVPRGPLPGGLGFALPAALLAVGAAGAIAFRGRPLRRGGYIAAALLLAVAGFSDVRTAARISTDRWLVDTRRLIQDAAARIPPPGVRVTLNELAALVQNTGGELVDGEPGESAPRRVQIDGVERAVVVITIGSNRWVELRTTPAELDAPRWIILLLPCALLGPIGILLLRWAERTPVRQQRVSAIAWGFLTPAIVHLLVFTIGPAIFAIYLALHSAGTVVGLANFRSVLDDPVMWHSFRNTLVYSLYVPVSVALALFAALMVHAHRTRWSGRLLGAAFLSPYVCSVVAIALLWQLIYQMGSLGVGRVDWLNNQATALAAVMLIAIWAHVGGQMMVFLVGLRRIPPSYLDAARVDGAGAWQRFWRITLPLLRPFTWFVVVTGFISAFQVFTLVFVLTQGGPLHSTDVLAYRVYQLAWGSPAGAGIGVGTAFAAAVFVLVVIFRWPQLKLLSRVVRDA